MGTPGFIKGRAKKSPANDDSEIRGYAMGVVADIRIHMPTLFKVYFWKNKRAVFNAIFLAQSQKWVQME